MKVMLLIMVMVLLAGCTSHTYGSVNAEVISCEFEEGAFASSIDIVLRLEDGQERTEYTPYVGTGNNCPEIGAHVCISTYDGKLQGIEGGCTWQ